MTRRTTYRPLGASVVAVVAGGCLVTVAVVMWMGFPAPVRDSFTTFQRATLVLVLLAALAVLLGIARASVSFDDVGLDVRNGYRCHHLDWAQVVAIHLARGAPWASIDTSDGRTVAVLALQGSDGDRALRMLRTLRRAVAAHSGREPPAGASGRTDPR